MEKHKPSTKHTEPKAGDAKKPTEKKDTMKPGAKPGHGPTKH